MTGDIIPTNQYFYQPIPSYQWPQTSTLTFTSVCNHKEPTMEEAMKIVKLLMDKGIIAQDMNVKDFLDLVEAIAELL